MGAGERRYRNTGDRRFGGAHRGVVERRLVGTGVAPNQPFGSPECAAAHWPPSIYDSECSNNSYDAEM
ncbi:hypothetical protein Athai_14690 [Actinocatenispora thailandica]|uniref:Uncharacterized protein n=1 Tax=Actinocatenispora thailandica TaxID=227318 RepID=A0A7R7HVT1_9ACTN|nr:hypothetical protein Athai_14690 [Actinocatenispora thailandica]